MDTTTRTWIACGNKHGIHKRHQRYIDALCVVSLCTCFDSVSLWDRLPPPDAMDMQTLFFVDFVVLLDQVCKSLFICTFFVNKFAKRIESLKALLKFPVIDISFSHLEILCFFCKLCKLGYCPRTVICLDVLCIWLVGRNTGLSVIPSCWQFDSYTLYWSPRLIDITYNFIIVISYSTFCWVSSRAFLTSSSSLSSCYCEALGAPNEMGRSRNCIYYYHKTCPF